MSLRLAITGSGAVSPAGWGLSALIEGSVAAPQPFEGAPNCLRRVVPKPEEKLPFLRHPRLRRGSPVARYLASAATEALGERRPERLAVMVSCYTGSVNYSSRFYSEVLAEPATASPILFPETVFNAPSSHLSALFGSGIVNHTLVGDESAFVTALDIAARWLVDDEADAVLVAAAEESDPLTAEALALGEDTPIVGEGAGALLIERSAERGVEIVEISEPITFTHSQSKAEASAKLGDADPGHDPDRIVERFGDCFGATPALAVVESAAALVRSGGSARIPIIGKNQAAASLRLETRL